jgi:hypothetical protein
VRFPLRRTHVDDRLAVLRLPAERGVPFPHERLTSEPVALAAAPQAPGVDPAHSDSDSREWHTESLLTALPVLTFANGRVTAGIVQADALQPEPELEGQIEGKAEATASPPPALPFALPLKGQFTAADSRADRLVRQIRGEVDELRRSLEDVGAERDELFEVDAAAVAANPEAAAALPAAVLVRTIVAAAERMHQLEAQVAHESKKASKVRGRLRATRLKEAARTSRLNTLEEVIAALHGNLEDLRGDRDHARQLAGGTEQPALCEGVMELHGPYPSLFERE